MALLALDLARRPDFLLFRLQQILITNNSALIFNRSDALTYGGVISGTGTFTKSGAGNLILTGTNTYTGTTTVSAGTLSVNGSLAGSVNLLSRRTTTLTPATPIACNRGPSRATHAQHARNVAFPARAQPRTAGANSN